MDTIEINIKSNAPQVEKETTSLRQQVKELRKEMESCAVGSDEYNAALVKLAQTTHDLKEQQEAVKNSAGDLGTALNNIQQVGTGIVAGFSSVNAIMALTGSSSEALQKTMVKLQAGIALVQGMQGLEGLPKKINATITSIKSLIAATTAETAANGALATSEGLLATVTKGLSNAFKGLKAALLSSGIGGIVVLVGALVTGMTALAGIIRKNLQVTNEYKDTNENLNKSFNEQNDALDLQIKYMEADGKSTSEIIAEKQKLTKAQIAETEAALENARARLSQLKNDSAWTRFWKGENKVIKEMEEETIPALEATLNQLQKKEANLNAESYADTKKTERDRNKAREDAAKKAVELAKKMAEEEKNMLADVEKSAKESFKNILEAYQQLLDDIKLVNTSVSSDLDAWTTVFGTDPKQLQTKLAGTYAGIVEYAVDAAGDEFNNKINALDINTITENLAKRLGKSTQKVTQQEIIDEFNKIQKEIAQEYYNVLKTLGKTLPPFDELFKFNTDEIAAVLAVNIPSIGSQFNALARGISKDFTNEFNALQRLFDDGILSYEEYYDTLLNKQRDYNQKVEDNRAAAQAQLQSDLDKGFITRQAYEEKLAQMEYEMSLKPKAFQDKVNAAILSAYKKNSEEALATLDGALTAIDNKLNTFNASYITWWQQISTLKTSYFQAQRTAIEEEEAAELEAYNSRKTMLEEQSQNDSLTVEQKALINQELANLEAEHTANMAEQTAKRNELRQEEIDYALDVADKSFSAMEGLFNGLNSLSKARVEELDRQLEAEEITQKEYDKLKKEEIEKQAAFQTGAAIMQTAAGITTAWATAMQLGFPAGPIIAGVQTAAFLVNLAAQLKSIENAKNSALSGNSSSASGVASTPDTSFTLQSADAYQTTLSDETQTDLQANAKNNQRVYVLESDITSKQDNVKSAVTTSTF